MPKVSENIRRLRTDMGLKQAELGKMLGKAPSVIANWEAGINRPDIDAIVKMCSIFQVDANTLLDLRLQAAAVASMTPDALRIGRAYDHAPVPIRKTVDTALEPYMMMKRTTGAEAAQESPPLLRELPLYTQAAAAGLGNYLDDANYDMVSFANVPKRANIAVRISGDSMEPAFCDGDIVFVELASTLRDGEIGIFHYDGQSYLKKLKLKPARLVSLNPKYEDISLQEGIGLYIVGRVVGKK